MWGLSYIDELVQTTVDGSAYYALTDGKYCVLGLVDGTGKFVERYEYTPDGRRQVYITSGGNDPDARTPTSQAPRRVVSTVAKPYALCTIGFQGLRHDAVTGNVYQRAREYSPRLARFMQRDPLGYPDGMNTYAAYHVMHGGLDPWGLQKHKTNRNRNGGDDKSTAEKVLPIFAFGLEFKARADRIQKRAAETLMGAPRSIKSMGDWGSRNVYALVFDSKMRKREIRCNAEAMLAIRGAVSKRFDAISNGDIEALADTFEDVGFGAGEAALTGKPLLPFRATRASLPNGSSNPGSPTTVSNPSVTPPLPKPTGGTPKVAFAHGTHIDSADNIASNGLNAAEAAARSKGGKLSNPGAFDAHPIGPPGNPGEGFQLAYEWSFRHAAPCDRRILVGEIDESLFLRLVDEKKISIDNIPGTEVPQWRFLPEAYNEVNNNAVWSVVNPAN